MEWGGLCSTGRAQSPIDLSDASDLSPWGDARVTYPAMRVRVVNTGRTLQGDCQGGGALVLAGSRYELLQVHFHAPGEHLLAGRAYPMEAHFVHRSAEGELAVLGVLLANGGSSAVLDGLLGMLPAEVGESGSEETVDLTELLPVGRRYFTYDGSLTTPPCDEGVRWLVMGEAVAIGAGQVERFREVLGANARPVQPLNGRPVYVGELGG